MTETQIVSPEWNDPFTWEVRLWERDPAKRYGILLAAAIAALIGYALFKNVAFALIGFGVIILATAEYWLPQKCRFDRNGASVRCGISVTAIQWNDVKSSVLDDGGVRLSPLSKEGRL